MKQFLLLVVVCTLSANAQQLERKGNNASADTVKTYEFPEVVVTATRSEKNPADVGRSITIISNDRLKGPLFTSLGDALTQQEGIYIVGAGQTPGMTQSIFMRGAASNQTTILVDDVRITDPSAVNNALDMSELSFAGLDRIEIVRGSHSTLYGSSAIGGVVNLITQKNRLPGFHVDAEARTGVFGKGTSLFAQDILFNYSNPAGLYFNAQANNTLFKGLDATVDTVKAVTPYKQRDKDGFKKFDLLGKIGFKNEFFDLYFSYKDTDQKTDIDKSAYRDDDNATLDFKRNLFTYGASFAITEALDIKYIGGYSSMKRYSVDDSSVVDNFGTTDRTYSEGEWNGTTRTNELQANLALSHLGVILGEGFYRETMSSKFYFYSRSIFGVYESRTNLDSLDLHAETKNFFAHVDVNGAMFGETFKRFALALGVRFNHHSVSGSATTYEVNPSFKVFDDGLLYGSYSTGFNAPSLYQMYSPDTYYASGISRGNRNLQPEKSSSFEIGLKQSLRTFSFSLSYFRTVVENSIEYVFLWDKNIGMDTLGNNWMRDDFRGDTYLNAGTQTTNGIEFSLSSRLSDRFWLSGNFSLVSGKLVYKPSDVRDMHTEGHHVQLYSNGAFLTREVESIGLVRRPNTANVSAHYQPMQSLTLRLDVRYVGSRNDVYYNSKLGPYGALATVPVDEYTLVDFSQKIMLTDNLAVQARIENVFDTKYAEINGFSTRGRGLFVSLRYMFDVQY